MNELENAIKEQIENGIKQYALREARRLSQLYYDDLNKELNELIAKVCIEVFRIIEMHKMGNTLEIRVKMPEKK